MRYLQFAAIILTALALVPGGAHLFALPNKIGLDRDAYMITQSVYRGWALAGIVLIAAMVMNLVLAILARRQRAAALLAAGAFLLIVLSLAVFFTWTYPANQATANWTTAPANWDQLRAQWEYSHAVNAALLFLALCAAIASGLIWKPDRPQAISRSR